MQQDLEKLAAEIGAEFAGATTEIEAYPNGTMMLNVRFKKKLFILGYVGNRWGVDMVRDGEIGDTGLRILSTDFGAGRADLLRLMRAP
jgi:hypothetical protein